jgi:hypothetical protein
MVVRPVHPIIPGAQVVAILMLMIAFFRMPPEYYTFLRCVVVVASIATIYDLSGRDIAPRLKWVAYFTFAVLALLFNPVFLCTFYRTTWGFIDFVAIVAFFMTVSGRRGLRE